MDQSPNGGNDSGPGESAWESHPVIWILVPICLLVIAASIITCLRYRRRSKMRALYYASNGPSGRGPGPPPFARPGDGRWQWVGANGPRRAMGRRRLGLSLGVSSREEGLNELGEAPPAYNAPGHKGVDTVYDMELGDMLRSATQATPTHSTFLSDSPTAPEVITTTSLPDYNEASQQPPAPPPAAVLGHNQRH